MRVAFYNQMFGLNGKNIFSNLEGHWAIHLQKNDKQIWKRVDLRRTYEIVKKSRADIIGICEILEGQELKLKRLLRSLGYRYIYFGEGHRTEFRKLHIKLAIASKIKCKKEYINKEPIENKLGGGGGLIDCYFPKLKINVMCVHLGIRNSLRNKQMLFLKNHLKKKEKFMLIGDFNCGYDKLKKYFGNLELISERIKTCSLTPLFHFFYWKDCDHILSRGLNKISIGFLEGYSDHRLIYADLE